MRRFRCAFALVALSVLAAAANAADPRPTVLVLGDKNSQPAGTGAAWTTIIQKAHPDWNVVVNAEEKRTIPELAKALPEILARQDHVEVVLVFVGTPDAAAKAYAENDAAKVGAAMGDIVKTLRSDDKTRNATILVATPMPVIDARLDKWSVEAYKDGEKNSDAIAAAIRTAAKDANATLIDFHQWAKDDKDGDKPGRLLGSIGWTVRDWGHPIMARYFDEHLAKANPTPPDAKAFAAWKAEQAARARLNEILSGTSEGLVNHGEPWASEAVTGKGGGSKIIVPTDALTGESLNVVFLPTDKDSAAIGPAVNLPGYRARLVATVEGEAKPIEIPLPATSWQVIDEGNPAGAVDPNRFRFNSGKMNYFGITSNAEGARKRMLARFPLEKLSGKKVTAAHIMVPHPGGLEIFTPPDKVQGVDIKTFGYATAAPLRGADAAWADAAATWKTRDGKQGWTGGKVDAAKRKAAIEEFLKTNPPAAVAEEARAAMP